MNEPAPPPHGPRGRRPDDWSSADWPPDAAADVSDTSVLPGPASTAVFPPDAGDAASARTAEFAADEATRVLPSAASRPPPPPCRCPPPVRRARRRAPRLP